MEIKNIKLPVTRVFLGIFLVLFFVQRSFAAPTPEAGASLSFTPKNGNFTVGNEFEAELNINGGGEDFNAAAATVNVPPSLLLEDLTLGNCNFAFVVTPTISDPTFAGVILGGSSNSCTLYTLKVKANQSSSNAALSINNASIKAYKGATELFSTSGNGSYTIKPASSTNSQIASNPSPILEPLIDELGNKLYTITYSITLPGVVNETQVLITLDPTLPSKITAKARSSKSKNTTFTAIFQNVIEGIHTITTYKDGKQLASQVINVAGNNRNINIGNQSPAKASSSIIIYIIIAIILLILSAGMGYLGWRYYKGKKADNKTETPADSNSKS